MWSDNTISFVANGTVRNNTLIGEKFGYGFVVASAVNFTVVDNVAKGTFSGSFTSLCPTVPLNGPPMAFLLNRGSSSGIFQKDFVNGEVQHGKLIFLLGCMNDMTTDGGHLVICIGDPESGMPSGRPRRYRSSPDTSKLQSSNYHQDQVSDSTL